MTNMYRLDDDAIDRVAQRYNQRAAIAGVPFIGKAEVRRTADDMARQVQRRFDEAMVAYLMDMEDDGMER